MGQIFSGPAGPRWKLLCGEEMSMLSRFSERLRGGKVKRGCKVQRGCKVKLLRAK